MTCTRWPACEQDRWRIPGIEMDAHSHGAEPSWDLRIYAADRHVDIQSFEDNYDRVAALQGGIPVVDVLLHDATLDDVIMCMNSVCSSETGISNTN